MTPWCLNSFFPCSFEVSALFLSGDTTSFRGKSPQFVVCSNPLPPNIKIPNCILEVMRSHFFIETHQNFLWVFLILNCKSALFESSDSHHTSIKFFNPILEMIHFRSGFTSALSKTCWYFTLLYWNLTTISHIFSIHIFPKRICLLTLIFCKVVVHVPCDTKKLECQNELHIWSRYMIFIYPLSMDF